MLALALAILVLGCYPIRSRPWGVGYALVCLLAMWLCAT